MNNTALIRHEITDRALMVLDIWEEFIAERLGGENPARGPVPENVSALVFTATCSIYDALNALSAWESAADDGESKA